MTPKLPREFLWTELDTIEDFIRLDPMNEDFYEFYLKFREEPFCVKIDAVKLFNEIYYQITRIFFEHPTSKAYPEYVSDIKAKLAWHYSADLVFSMVFWLTDIMTEKPREVFRVYLMDMVIGSKFWIPVRRCYEQLKQSGKRLKYDFKPRPDSSYLMNKDIDWQDLTLNFDSDAISCIIALWDNTEDRDKVAAMINEVMPMPTQQPVEEEPNLFQTGRFLRKVLVPKDGNKWFDKVRTHHRYTEKWREAFVDALLASEYGWDIAKTWEKKRKRESLKGYVVGCLKDTGVISGTYDGIAKVMGYGEESYRSFSRYLGRGKNQIFFEWIKDYVEKSKLGQ